MLKFATAGLAALLLTACALVRPPQAATPQAPTASSLPDIPYTEFTLDNGLRLIVHEDRKAPLVAVNIWYHVGSKDEQPGKTGFAHLFEHLMFNGSEHHDGEFFEPLEDVGATDMNGTTNVDRTNYFATVPTPALDRLLWLESDRMGHLLGAITQEKLDEQREVVKNEKRQRENQPYGKIWTAIAENSYPAGHPYSWPIIGSMEDLDAATLDDVHAWFKAHYGPNNATIVIAGDISPDDALRKVQHYFGGIEPGPPLNKQTAWVAPMAADQRIDMQDRVPQARVYRLWNVPGYNTLQQSHLALAAQDLGNGKTSRLYRRLVSDEQLATSVAAFMWNKQLGSQFFVVATVTPGTPVEAVEAALDEEIQRFLDEGPSTDSLARIRTGLDAQFIRGSETIGGFGGKSDILARSAVFGDTPDSWKRVRQWIHEATPADVRATANQWLRKGHLTLRVQPFDQSLSASDSSVDRSALPDGGTPPDLRLPGVQTATLDNGLRIVLAERHSTPLVRLTLIAGGGYAADLGGKPGTSGMTLAMMDEGTRTRTALDIATEQETLGASIGSDSLLDVTQISLSAIKPRLRESIALWADIIRNPTFPPDELDKLRERWLASIAQEKARPVTLATRVLPPLLYGDTHAYGQPLTGSGTEASIAAMTREELVAFYRRWLRPDTATVLVVGDTTMDEIRPLLDAALGDWPVPADPPPAKQLPTVARPTQPQVYLLDRPGAEQSIILAGHVIPPAKAVDDPAFELVNTVLGGGFTSRINMNLREDKGWTYGARSLMLDARAQRPFIVYAPVQTDRTIDSIREIQSELRAILGPRPPQGDEVDRAKNKLTLTLPGRNETSGDIAGTLAESIVYDLPWDYYEQYVSRVRSAGAARLNAAAQALIHPEALTWVIVGDLSRIEAEVRSLNIGPVTLLDAEGRPRTTP